MRRGQISMTDFKVRKDNKMKKNIKKIIAYVICICCMMNVVACNNDAASNNTKGNNKTLKVKVIERGYGVSWLEKIAEKFMEENKGYVVEVLTTVDGNEISSDFSLGSKYNDVDIFFDLQYMGFATKYQDSKGDFKDEGYEEGLADLTDLYEMTVPGEKVTFGEKMNLSVKESMDYNGHYYAVPWTVGPTGIFYNHTVFQSALGSDYTLPRTTDELVEVCNTLKGKVVLNRNNEKKNVTPLIYAGQLNYWEYLYLPWWAQYEGLDDFSMFFEGKVMDEITGNYLYSKDIFAQEGRMEALQVMEKLLADESGFKSTEFVPNEYGASNFRTLQTNFLYKNEFAMMPNGDWLAKESGEGRSFEVGIMKTPVISSIIDRLSTVNDEDTLRMVIDYVDGVLETAPSGVSEEDIEEVRTARCMIMSAASEHVAYVPSYSKDIELAKKFLLYMAKDSSLKIYNEETQGCFLPFDYSNVDVAKDSLYIETVYNMQKDAICVDRISNSDIFVLGGATAINAQFGTYEALLGSKTNSEIYRSAKQIFESELKTQQEWDKMLELAGIK